jgi:hypothetical protein
MYETAKASIKGIFCSGLKSESVTGVGYCALYQQNLNCNDSAEDIFFFF